VTVLRTLADLVLPVTCAGCGEPGRAVCPRCLAAWAGPPRRCEDAAGRLDRLDGTVLPVAALAVGAPAVRRVVAAWKDGGRADVTPWFAAVARRAAAGVVASGVPAGSGRPLVVVPAPPSPAGLARRGEDLVAHVARGLAAGLAEQGAGPGAPRAAPAGLAEQGAGPGAPRAAPVLRALRLAGRGRDQVGLGVRGRAANLAGRVRVRRRARAALAGTDVLLVDDVLTTGATLAACRAALEAAGARPAGAVVLAVTPSPGAAPGWLEPSANPG